MVYRMDFYVDGACRGNGQPGSIAAAAAVFKEKSGRNAACTRVLPLHPRPTNQRAEITAIILALEEALERYERLNKNPSLDVTIFSDSKYAVKCMNTFIYKWSENGWTNAKGDEIANRALIKHASDLDDRVRAKGHVRYEWIPRAENELADDICNEALDNYERY